MARRPFPPFSPHFGLSNRFFDELRDFELDRHIPRPYWTESTLQNAQKLGEGVGEIVDNEDAFSITLDVSQFAPEELKVNVVDGVLVIEGKHSPKDDQYGQIERHFVRKLALPKNAKPETVTSELSKEGLLTIQTPKKAIEPQRTRTIPIFRKD